VESNHKSVEEILLLRPTHGWASLNLKDLWRYRELTYFLIWRDIKVRYKQTLLGASWAILQPFLAMVVFSIFFGGLAKIPSDDVPYPIFNYTGLLPWTLFAKAINDAGRSMVANRTMITKIYFPRMVIPLASVLSGLVDFFLAFLVLIGMMVYYNFAPNSTYQVVITPAILTLPFFILLALVTSLGVGLWFAALNVNYRDINYVLPFITQLWLFLTPVIYPSSMLSEKWQLIYSLNPMAGVVNGFRWALLGIDTGVTGTILISTTVAILVLITGLFYFKRMERTFADMI
jgi:lipopolysaccharide transport system permease protein